MQGSIESEGDARLMIREMEEALARGTEHYDINGRLLTSPKEIIDAMLRDGMIQFKPKEKTD